MSTAGAGCAPQSSAGARPGERIRLPGFVGTSGTAAHSSKRGYGRERAVSRDALVELVLRDEGQRRQAMAAAGPEQREDRRRVGVRGCTHSARRSRPRRATTATAAAPP
eukprot:7240385-Prymnesium_polylepis.1